MPHEHKEPRFAPKNLPTGDFLSRFLTRSPKYFPNWHPLEDLLYIEDEKFFYLYDAGAYRPLSANDALTRKVFDFIHLEKTEEFGRDELTTPPTLPFHPLTPDDLPSIERQLLTIPLLLPENNVQPSRPSSSVLTFEDLRAVDLADYANDFPLLEASRAQHSFLKVPAPSHLFHAPWDPMNECPRFYEFLHEIFVTEDTAFDPIPTPDLDMITFIQEVFGYALFDKDPTHNCFFFHGGGQNGKSVLLDVIGLMFPENLVSGLRLEDFTLSNFRTAELKGKRVNIIHEEQSERIRVDLLKNIVSGNAMLIEEKYKQPAKFVPSVKFFWGTNDLPSFDDIDKALKRRINVIPFHRQIPEESRDLFLMDKLKKELPGILHFAFEGARRFAKRGFVFNKPKAVTDAMEGVIEDRFPAVRFFHEYYEITGDPEDKVATKLLYQEYVNWCDGNGFRNKLNIVNFSKQLSRVDPVKIRGGDEIRMTIGGKKVQARSGLRRRDGVSSEYLPLIQL